MVLSVSKPTGTVATRVVDRNCVTESCTEVMTDTSVWVLTLAGGTEAEAESVAKVTPAAEVAGVRVVAGKGAIDGAADDGTIDAGTTVVAGATVTGATVVAGATVTGAAVVAGAGLGDGSAATTALLRTAVSMPSWATGPVPSPFLR